jgi:hypothetical protein
MDVHCPGVGNRGKQGAPCSSRKSGKAAAQSEIPHFKTGSGRGMAGIFVSQRDEDECVTKKELFAGE